MNDYAFDIIERELRQKLYLELRRAGFLFRLHSRVKDPNSIFEKSLRKSYDKNKKMQDIIGFRITTYFIDDVYIIVGMCKSLFSMIELVYDQPEEDVFKPLRKNMICRMSDSHSKLFNELALKDKVLNQVDNTFEIQFRTTLSEGWHEVDHSLRYKCKDDWTDLNKESRMLNGIYATLETNDHALLALFDDIAYRHYKNRKWEAMIRNKFRMNFILKALNANLIDFFENNSEVGKSFFRLNREDAIESFIKSNIVVPISFDFIVYFMNFFFIKNIDLINLTPSVLLVQFEEYQTSATLSDVKSPIL